MLKNIKKLLSEGFSNLTLWIFVIGTFLCGLIMMVLGSRRLHGKELYLVLAVGGILIISALVTMALKKAKIIGGVEAEHKNDLDRLKQENKDLRDGIEDLKQKNADSVNKQKLLTKELKDAQNRAIRTLAHKFCLDLALIKQECEITRSFERYFDEDEREVNMDTEVEEVEDGIETPEIKQRFLGTLKAKFVANYGFDMKKVKFKVVDAEKTIYFGGVEPTFRSFATPVCPTWEISIGLKKGTFTEWKTNKDSLKLENYYKDIYQKEMTESLTKGPELPGYMKKTLSMYIRLFLKRFIAPVIAPPDYKVEFLETLGEDSVTLNKFLDNPDLRSLT